MLKCFDDVHNLLQGVLLLPDDGSLLVNEGLFGDAARHKLLHKRALQLHHVQVLTSVDVHTCKRCLTMFYNTWRGFHIARITITQIGM